MTAVVLGVGRMGRAICWAMSQLGFGVVGADTNWNAENEMLPETGEFLPIKSIEDVYHWIEERGKPDILISSLPYHQTQKVAFWCIDNGIRYCDLGGRVDVSKNINNYATDKATKPVFTDLGLAPGWINIIAEQGRKEVRGAKDIEMYVGGLPRVVNAWNPLKYETTWSVDGLINEYKDDCLVLRHGETQTVKGMEGHAVIDFCGSELEAFYTSGGAAHTIEAMKKAGVENCSYKTLRYKGHRNIVRFLIKRCDLSHQDLEKIFSNGCSESGNGDRVLMHVKAVNGELEWKKYIEILGDARFSAMQQATAFPISCVASLMARGELEGDKEQHRDYWTQYPEALTYDDVPYDEFKNLLSEKLGLENFLDPIDGL